MTQKEKQLLLQDISARLLYGVKVQVCNLKEYAPTVKGLLNDELYVQFDYIIKPIKNGDSTYNIINDNVKPYLRPMSSMTDEEKKFYYGIVHIQRFEGNYEIDVPADNPITTIEISRISELINWLNEHCFDYKGLIDMGLAIEAPKEMYNFE